MSFLDSKYSNPIRTRNGSKILRVFYEYLIIDLNRSGPEKHRSEPKNFKYLLDLNVYDPKDLDLKKNRLETNPKTPKRMPNLRRRLMGKKKRNV